ncbi:AAA family ATPase [archaeon]|nr:AAA family ATPase [archaeon]
MKRTIIITGTPGTGKTTLAKKLARETGHKYLDLYKFAIDNGLAAGYDKKRKCRIVDEKKLAAKIVGYIKKNKNCSLIIDSHLSHYIPKRYADLCVVAKCGLKELAKRLKRKAYSKKKIRENLDAEIFDVCYEEAKALKHNILVLDTSKTNINKSLKKISSYIKKISKNK